MNKMLSAFVTWHKASSHDVRLCLACQCVHRQAWNSQTRSKGYAMTHCLSKCYSSWWLVPSDICSRPPSIDQLILLIPFFEVLWEELRACSSEALDGFVSNPWMEKKGRVACMIKKKSIFFWEVTKLYGFTVDMECGWCTVVRWWEDLV